jgi:Ca2+-binding RTX toxin-like protein
MIRTATRRLAMAIVYGTSRSETIDARDGVTNGADWIYGYGGNDTIYGLGGDDHVVGGSGADIINGGAGNDSAHYTDSTQGVTVSLVSNEGIGGTAQGDRLISIEHLFGSHHDDLLVGNDGFNVLRGNSRNDVLKGGGGSDHLYGDSDDDLLIGGSGGDYLDGGDGIDTASYDGSPIGVYVSLIGGYAENGDAWGDTFSSIENFTGSAYRDYLHGDNGINVLRGMGGDDSLHGFDGADTLEGGDGDDYLDGGYGDDILRGDAGSDTMRGGSDGADTFYVDNAGDVVWDSSASTFDTVYATVSYTLGANADIELFRTTNDTYTTAINLTGNQSSQQIVGNNGNNVISGADGNDQLTGLAGQDSFLFNTALDAAANVDVITDFNVADDTIQLENAVFSTLTAGAPLDASQFVIGPAQAANDRILYDDSTGALFYDSDGTGTTAAVQFAELSPGLALTSQDFLVV